MSPFSRQCPHLLFVLPYWQSGLDGDCPPPNNPFWHCPSGSVLYLPLVLTPSLPSASGEFNSYDADHREYMRPLCYLYVCASFFFSVDPPPHPSWNQGYFSIFAFSTLGTPGAKQSSFSHTKGKRPGYLPLSSEVPTPLLSTQLCLSWRFQGSSGEVRGKQEKPLTLCGQLPD